MTGVILRALPRSNQVAINVAAIVVNYNGWRDTTRCIRSLQESSICPKYVIVVDNHSTDESWRQLATLFGGLAPPVGYASASSDATGTTGRITVNLQPSSEEVIFILVDARTNGGFGAGNNVGARLLRQNGFRGYLWLLNNDAEAFADCLEQLKALGDQGALPDVVGTTLVDLEAPRRVQACGANLSYVGLLSRHLRVGEDLAALQSRDALVYADYPIGASFLIHTDLLRDEDPFDERYFLYFEEPALMQRLGIPRVAVSTRAVVAHKGGASTGAFEAPRAWNALADFHSIRSRILFGRQCGPVSALAAVASGIAIAAKRLWHVGPRAASNALRGVFSAIVAPGPSLRHR